MKKKRKETKRQTHIFGDSLRVLIMMVALAVFLYSGLKLLGFYNEYREGSEEYDNLEAQYSVSSQEEVDEIDALEDDDALELLQQEISEDALLGGELAMDEEDLGPLGTVHDVNGRFLVTAEENGKKKALPVMTSPVDFAELQDINPDICGWLRIRGIDISYPLVQGVDNEYYLHRTFEKTANFAGCLFLNYENSRYFTDQNTIIYGHNMKNGSMFGKLSNFRDEKTLGKSKFFWIFTPDYIYMYRIISGMVVPQVGDTYRTFFSKDKFQEFLDNAAERSELPQDPVNVTTDDRIVTLSTCTGDSSTRFVLMGKLTQVFLPRDKVEQKNKTGSDG